MMEEAMLKQHAIKTQTALFVLLFLLYMAGSLLGKYYLLESNYNNSTILAQNGFELLNKSGAREIDFLAEDSELAKLDSLGIKYKTKISDLEHYYATRLENRKDSY